MPDGNALLGKVCDSRGAPMGRVEISQDPDAVVTLFRVSLVDGYDRGGAYWGGGEPLYAAIGDDFQSFVRAPHWDAAKALLQARHPGLRICEEKVNGDFVEGYIAAAVWADDVDPDMDSETRGQIVEDCGVFLKRCGHLITRENCRRDVENPFSQAGHDFWLTRCGHGAGFWDGDWAEPAATELTCVSADLGEPHWMDSLRGPGKTDEDRARGRVLSVDAD